MSTLPGMSSDTSSPPEQAGDRVGVQGRGRPVPIKEAATSLGISINTVRRWIREGRLTTERVARPQGYVVYVHLPEQVPDPEHLPNDVPTHHLSEQVPIARDIMRAEAMAAYTRSLLEPLVQTIERQAEAIADLREERGRQGAELERAASTIVTLNAALEARTPAQNEHALKDLSPPRWRSWGAWVLALAALVAVVALLAVRW